MDMEKIKKAEAEAERFLGRVFDLGEALARGDYVLQGSRESGALRRASMDLTRALADLRRP